MIQDKELCSDVVAELFEETNSLESIPFVRKKLLREKSLVDSQLQTGIQAQMRLLSDGMQKLGFAHENIIVSKSRLTNMSDLYSGSSQHVENFEEASELASILANFDMTEKFMKHFESFDEQLNLVLKMMKADGEFDVDKKMPNFVAIHYTLNQLVQVKEEAISNLISKDSTSDTRVTIKKLYEPLDRVVDKFDDTLITIAELLLEIIRAKNRSLVVRTAKIIENEERNDIVARFSKRSHNSKSTSGSFSTKFTGREPRRCLDKFFKAIESSIKSQFDECMKQYHPDTDPKLLLENLDFINSELICAKEELVLCCPERWQIFNKYVMWYHQGVHRVLETIMRFEPPAEILLEILRYVKEYYSTMSSVFGVSKKSTPELLNPPLLDGRERDLYDDYLKILIVKLKQWYSTIWNREKHEFENDIFHPEYHSDGVGLESHTTVTKLIAQQLEVAANCGQARVIAGCVDACCEIISTRQKDWIILVRDVTQKATSGDPTAPQGLFEYLFVIANDQDRAYAFLEQLSAKWSEPMPPRYQSRVIERFSEAQEGYQDVTKECFLMTLKIIYSDTQPAFKEVLRSDKWYSGVSIQAIVDTYADFVSDAKKLLLKDLFEIFLGKLCTETILWYLRAMVPASGHKLKKLNMPRGKDRILNDAKALFDFFTSEECGLDPDITRKVFYIFDLFCDVLTVPLQDSPALFRELRLNERDAPLDLFESMLNLRKDVDSKNIKDIMISVRSAAVQSEPVALEEGEELGHSFLYDFNRTQ